MNFPYYVVKAFSSAPLRGNAVGVVLVSEELSSQTMQRIARINNFSETVFLYREEGQVSYYIWWYTPDTEAFDVGEATLAAQYVLFEHIHREEDIQNIVLNWIGGQRLVSRESYLTLNYSPEQRIEPVNIGNVEEGLGEGDFYACGDNLVVKLENCDAVRDYQFDKNAFQLLGYKGLIVTAEDFEHDYCCRYFSSDKGFSESEISALIHSYLSRFWAKQNGSIGLSGIQYSPSPGLVTSWQSGQDLRLSGDCCLYAKGEMAL